MCKLVGLYRLLVCLLSETALLLIMLFLGIYSLKQNKTLMNILDDGEMNVMRNQYWILAVVTFIRFLSNGLFVIFYLQHAGNN